MISQEVTFQKITVNARLPATKLKYGQKSVRPFVEVLSEQFL